MPTPSMTLRRIQVNDATAIAQLTADPEVFANMLQLPYPTEEAWVKRLSTPQTGNGLQLVALQGDQVIGFAGLHSAGPQVRRNHAVGLGISVARHAHGQGVGSALMRALTDYADQWGHILRIELTVFTDNARAIALYERFGFVHEGTHRAYALRHGQYHDVHSMARLHPQPPRWS
jgi:L-phenylalanine/L-methionine N-acetyltransferase